MVTFMQLGLKLELRSLIFIVLSGANIHYRVAANDNVEHREIMAYSICDRERNFTITIISLVGYCCRRLRRLKCILTPGVVRAKCRS